MGTAKQSMWSSVTDFKINVRLNQSVRQESASCEGMKNSTLERYASLTDKSNLIKSTGRRHCDNNMTASEWQQRDRESKKDKGSDGHNWTTPTKRRRQKRGKDGNQYSNDKTKTKTTTTRRQEYNEDNDNTM